MAAQTSIERLILRGPTYGMTNKVAAPSTTGNTTTPATSRTTNTMHELW